MKTGTELVAEKLKEQHEKGFNPEHDARLKEGQLLILASYLILSNEDNMPKTGWAKDYVKQFHLLPRVEQLAAAAALLIAEIDRRQYVDPESLELKVSGA